MLIVFWFKEKVRNTPCNYLLLTGFTLFESYIVGTIVNIYGPQIVYMPVVVILSLITSLTIYAFTTKKYYTYQGATLFILATGLILFGIFYWIYNYDFWYITWCVLGVILYSYYLVYETL
jgi:hypothetical protein